MKLTGKAKLLANIKKMPNGCWEWQAGRVKSGYGQCAKSDFPDRYVHRWSYTLYKGSIPKGLLVRHTCDNTPCANPKHLILGTNLDNILDCIARGRTNGRLQKMHAALAYRCKDAVFIRARTNKIQEGLQRAKRHKICLWCSSEFSALPWAKFCTPACSYKFKTFGDWLPAHHPAIRQAKICLWCGEIFLGLNRGKFCNKKCRLSLSNFGMSRPNREVK